MNNNLVEENIKLVYYVANKFKNYDKDEIISACQLGLIKSVNNFNRNKNLNFSTFAVKCMINECLMYIRSYKRKNINNILHFSDTVSSVNDELDFESMIDDKQQIDDSYLNLKYILLNELSRYKPQTRGIILLHLRGFKQNEISKYRKTSKANINKIIWKFRKNMEEKLYGK